MSADLLRRAARTLREHAEKLPEPWRSEPWRVVQTDTYHDDGIASCTDAHADDPTGSPDCCWSTESLGHESIASLVVLMHPPVALALADFLDVMAEIAEYAALRGYQTNEQCRAADAVARAILREAPDA